MEKQKSFVYTENLTVGYDGKPLIRDIRLSLEKGQILPISENTIWNMKDDSVVTHLTNSDSIINLSYDDGQTFTQGKTLTVKGNYVGNNGQLNIRTVLGDDKSATDRLIVEGNTSGSTTVYVKNAGGSGAATLNGIELITVNGDESPADAFR